MRLIDQLMQHPLLVERSIPQVLEPMGFEVHIRAVEAPVDEDEEPENHEAFMRDPAAYMDSLPFEVPEGFVELGRFDTEDSEIVFLAVRPTTPLAGMLLAPADEEAVLVAGPGVASLGALADERQRQVLDEDWSFEHDDQHKDGELAQAAACYAEQATAEAELQREGYPGADKS